MRRLHKAFWLMGGDAVGRAIIVRRGVGRIFKKPATNLSRMSSAWPTLVALAGC